MDWHCGGSVVGSGCADVFWVPGRGGASHGQSGRAWDLQTRKRREGNCVGCVIFVAATDGQSRDAHAQDSEII